VITVDKDVNPRDFLEVEWALTTRCQPDRDFIVIPSLRGQPIDPSAGEGFATAKVGIDATRPKKEGFEKVGFPDAVQNRVASIINDLKKRG
jgi:2,5-furandicarboxylate decarboxylase 1